MTPLPSPPLRTSIAALVGRSVAGLSRAAGRGEGSVIGGRVAIALDPHALERLAKWRDIILVSGTNGKTTTTSMVAAACRTRGDVVTNVAGANMFGGMVSSLMSSRASVAVLETDEGHLPRAVELVSPRIVVLLNLSRDQLDRVGEVRMTAKRWRDALTGFGGIVVANADDPMVVWAASAARQVVWVAGGSGWRLDAGSCPSCGARIQWTTGEWACSSCELTRPDPHAFFTTKEIAERRVGRQLTLPINLRLPGEINRRNAAMALTASLLLGSEPHAANMAVSKLEGMGGRFMSVRIGDVRARLLLAKNPAGWAEALRLIRPGETPVIVAINARVQDGRDPSWLWDVPFEQLRGRYLVATGERGRDLAVRLHYADVDHEFVDGPMQSVQFAASQLYDKVEELQPDHSERALEHVDDIVRGTEIDIIANYSAFQEFRRIVRI